MTDMSEVDAWVGNAEVGHLIPQVDERFEGRYGTSRLSFAEAEPQGGEWVTNWMSVLHEVGTEEVSRFAQPMTGILLGLPSRDAPHGVADEVWWASWDVVNRLTSEVHTAYSSWHFAQARQKAGELWTALNQLWEYYSEKFGTIESEWGDLRPLL